MCLRNYSTKEGRKDKVRSAWFDLKEVASFGNSLNSVPAPETVFSHKNVGNIENFPITCYLTLSVA